MIPHASPEYHRFAPRESCYKHALAAAIPTSPYPPSQLTQTRVGALIMASIPGTTQRAVPNPHNAPPTLNVCSYRKAPGQEARSRS
jgi:hypothetical protein